MLLSVTSHLRGMGKHRQMWVYSVVIPGRMHASQVKPDRPLALLNPNTFEVHKGSTE